MKKKVISLLLALCLVLSLVPCMAFAASSGQCGDNVTWTCSGSTLTISGTGDMWDTDDKQSAYGWSGAVDYWELNKIVIGEGVTGVGDYAFYDYPYVTSVTLPSTLKSIGDYAFYNAAMTSVSLPAGLEEIGISAFSACNELSSAALPSSLQKLGKYAFSHTAIRSITIPGKVREIPERAFGSCLSLETVTLSAGLETIGDSAFSACSALKSVTIPATVRSIEASAFQYCLGLTNIWVDSGNSYYASVDGVLFNKAKTELVRYPGGGKAVYTVPAGTKTIGQSAFVQCDHLTSVTVPDGVTAIGDSAFELCTALTTVTIADSVKTIGSRAFAQCFKLNSVKLPVGLTTISESLFYACGALETVKIPYGVTTIEDAFVFSGLKSLDIPASVTKINGIYGCNSGNTTTVRFYGNAPAMSDDCFLSTTVTAYYPAGNSTWTSSVRGNYGGTVTWKSFTPAPPTAPKAPTLSISKSNGKITLSWNAVDGANKYWIYRSTDGTNYKYYDTTYNTSYTNSSVTSGTRYYYKVKAVTTVGSKDYISGYSGYKSTIPLTTPTLSVSMSNGAAKLSWGKVTGATKYYIYRGTSSSNLSYYDSTTNTSYTNSSVSGGTTYYYKVKAVKTVSGTDWTSDYSSVKSVKILKVPTISVSKSNGKVTVSWDAVSGAAKYYIYRSTDGTNFKYYDSTTKTSYTNSSVTSGTRYYYKVKAVDANGGATKQSSAKSTIPLTTPTLSGKLSSGKVYLSWGSVTGATKYYIYRGTSSTNLSYYGTTTKTSYTNSSVTAGHTYYYKVKAVKTVNGTDWTSSYSNVVSIKR